MLRLFFQRVSHNREADRILCAYRTEAKAVPNLLVASVSSTLKSQRSDLHANHPQGYYSDGAYTATPLPHSAPNQAHTNGGQPEDQNAQEAYYTSLCARFTRLTKTLQSPPPRAEPDNTSVYYLDWQQPRLWRKKILHTTPTMILLVQLTQESIICGLEVLESLLTLANLRGTNGKRIGAWIWGLLGRCREVGQMGSEEVGVLRNLGKQAVWLLRRISAGEVIEGAADEPEPEVGIEDEEDGEGDDEGQGLQDDEDFPDAVDANSDRSLSIDPITTAVLGQDRKKDVDPAAAMSDVDLLKAKQRILDSLGNNQAQIGSIETNPRNKDGTPNPRPTPPITKMEVDGEENLARRADEKVTVHATLNMLVTIVGEMYGQRDLLSGRLVWDEMQPQFGAEEGRA